MMSGFIRDAPGPFDEEQDYFQLHGTPGAKHYEALTDQHQVRLDPQACVLACSIGVSMCLRSY